MNKLQTAITAHVDKKLHNEDNKSINTKISYVF